MFVEERQQKILELLQENEKVRVKELSQMLTKLYPERYDHLEEHSI